MEPIFICFYDSMYHEYAGYGNTPEEAKKACLKGYRAMVKKMSGDRISVKEFNDDSWIEEVKMGKCLVDSGRQGWL